MRRCISCSISLLAAVALLLGSPALADPGGAKTPDNPAADAKAAGQQGEASAAEAEKPADDSGKSADAEDQAKQPAAEEAQKPAPAKPKALTVKKGLLKIQVSLSGVFEAERMGEIMLEPEAWSTLKLLKAAEHGTKVKKGELLLALDLEKIDRAINDLRKENKLSDLSLKLAERQLQTLEKTTPLDLEANERTHRYVQEDFNYYRKVARPLDVKSAEFALKSAQQSFEYQQEEVRQLEKMYKADDLTEETEEIILKRARNALERAKFYLEEAKIMHERTLKVLMPRRDIRMKESAVRSDIAWNEAEVSLPLNLEKQRMELEKLKLASARSQEKLQKLEADRAAMTVKAPMSGIVYHGKCTRGKFSGGSSSTAELREGASVSANKVLMTVVKPRPIFIRTAVPENQLHQVRAGVKGTVVPTAFPQMKLTAIVDRVDAVPMTSGSFDARITVALDDEAEALMPAMTCKVKLVTCLKKDALTVPPKAIETDQLDERKHYVYVLDKEEKPQKREVTLGKRTAEKVEILKGLSEGERILAEPPKKDG